jgi:hypothetical protein
MKYRTRAAIIFFAGTVMLVPPGASSLPSAGPTRPDANLFLARVSKFSPFADGMGVLYVCGFNSSYRKGPLGTAWIYKGMLPSNAKPTSTP